MYDRVDDSLSNMAVNQSTYMGEMHGVTYRSLILQTHKDKIEQKHPKNRRFRFELECGL